MAAKLEEVVAHADAESSEQAFPDRHQRSFGEPQRLACYGSVRLGCGRTRRQLPAVDLAIRQQWQAGQLDETTRDEVLWQSRGEQLTPTVHAARIPGDNEGGQRLAVAGSTCHDRRLFDAGMLE